MTPTYKAHSTMLFAQTFGEKVAPDSSDGLDPDRIARQMMHPDDHAAVNQAADAARHAWNKANHQKFSIIEEADNDFERALDEQLKNVQRTDMQPQHHYCIRTLASPRYRPIFDEFNNEVGHDTIKYLASRPLDGSAAAAPVMFNGELPPLTKTIAYITIVVSYAVEQS